MTPLQSARQNMNRLRETYQEQRRLLADCNKIINQGSPAFLPKTIEFAQDMRSRTFSSMNRTRAALKKAIKHTEAALRQAQNTRHQHYA